MHRVEAMRGTQKIIRRFRTATNAGELSHAVWLDIEFIASLDDCGTDGIMPAAGTQR